MNAPVAATLRGKSAVTEVHNLLGQLRKVEEDIEAFSAHGFDVEIGHGDAIIAIITPVEVIEVLGRRRDAILLKLENKGIIVRPDVEPTKPVQLVERDELTEALDALEEK